MFVTINNKILEISDAPCYVRALILSRYPGYKENYLIFNGRMLGKDKWESTLLNNADIITLIPSPNPC